jgi:hypothetical protein
LDELHGGLGPELLGVCEVEGDDVLEQLQVVKDPIGTSDLRGIDVSLAFDDRKLAVVEARSHVVHLRYQTRDIFEVVFELVERAIGCDRQPLALAPKGPVGVAAAADRGGGEHRLPRSRPRTG